MQRYLLISILTLAVFSAPEAVAQEHKRPVIQKITLSDSCLLGFLKKFIAEEEPKNSPYFSKGKGYVYIDYEYGFWGGNQKLEADTVFKAVFTMSIMHPDESVNLVGDSYPLFYSFVSGHPIFIGGGNALARFVEIDDKSKREFLKVVEPYVYLGKERVLPFDLSHFAKVFYLRNRDSEKITCHMRYEDR